MLLIVGCGDSDKEQSSGSTAQTPESTEPPAYLGEYSKRPEVKESVGSCTESSDVCYGIETEDGKDALLRAHSAVVSSLVTCVQPPSGTKKCEDTKLKSDKDSGLGDFPIVSLSWLDTFGVDGNGIYTVSWGSSESEILGELKFDYQDGTLMIKSANS